MKTSLLFLTFFLNLSIAITQTQIGDDINGEATGDFFGWSVALSADGLRLAASGPGNDENAFNSGHVRVYERDGVNWNQLGEDIDGFIPNGSFGNSISFSDDGNILAIGIPQNTADDSPPGTVQVYEWNGQNWEQMGEDIIGDGLSDGFGTKLDISADGHKIAIGGPDHSTSSSINAGHVWVLEWNGNEWTTIGEDIEGIGEGDNFGTPVALSGDGNRVMIGAPLNDTNGASSGQVRVYDWNGTNWTQAGMTINGETLFDFFSQSIAISSDGNTLAIGAPQNDNIGSNAGEVKLYEWTGSDWTQIGQDIQGVSSDENIGWSLALSSNGNRLIIGSIQNDDNGNNAGQVKIFDRNGDLWEQILMPINGDAPGDNAGRSVAISADGNSLVIGLSGSQDFRGQVKVYDITIVSVNPFAEYKNIEIRPNPTNGIVYFKEIEKGEVQVINNLGEVMIEKTLTKSELDLSPLANGLYFIFIKTNNELFLGKVTKQ